jgi:hypothetical protein
VNRLAVEDHLGVAVNERVVIGIPDGLLVRASVAAYGLPLIALVTAAGIAEWLRAPELAVAAAGVAGLAAGLWLTGRLTGGSVARRRYQPVLLRREHPTVRIPFQTGAATDGGRTDRHKPSKRRGKPMSAAAAEILTEDPVLETDFAKEMIRQMRAIDSYGTYDNWPPGKILEPLSSPRRRSARSR